MANSWKRILLCGLLVCGVASSSIADHTRRWRQSTYEEFLKGTAKGVAVRSDGHLELAPKFTAIADADASYLWSLKTDGAGTLYAGGGSPAKVFKFEGSGKPKAVFESTDLLAQCIAFDGKGTLFVGTSPDGKVYKVAANGEKSVFFEPKTKYIWDLAFGADGTLYVATGDKGLIYAVSPDGKGDVYYDSDEAHIKNLTFDSKGNLLAGTEPNGRVLQISRAGGQKGSSGAASGFVVYETGKREVTSLVVAADGTTYVAAIGEKSRGGQTSQPGIVTGPQNVAPIGVTGTAGATIAAPFVAFPQAISSSIYKIPTNGVPEEIWTSRDEVVYALGLNSDGRLLAGTGNSGALLVIDGRGVYAQLAKSGSAQITGISRAAGGKVYLCTANPGKVFSLGPEYESEGTFESQSFDAKLFSQWGRIEWWGPPATSGTGKSGKERKEPRLEIFVRSGNTEDPGKEWSPWSGPYTASDALIEAPAARFLQWKAVIHDGRPGDGVDWVSVSYQPRNVTPVIDGIALQDAGVRAVAPSVIQGTQNVALKQPPTANPAAATGVVVVTTPPKFEPQPQGMVQKGYQAVLWSAHDDNEDDLKYEVYFRGENQQNWLLLKDNLDQKFYSWDTTSMPDGAYYLKVVASDAPSNPPASALSAERESERFEVDNTNPTIGKIEASATGMNADRSQGVSYDFQFTASHPSSSIERAQYSVDGGEWILLAPDKGISDYKTETYSFTVRHLMPGEHTIAVRAYDRFDNVGSAKTTITIAGH